VDDVPRGSRVSVGSLWYPSHGHPDGACDRPWFLVRDGLGYRTDHNPAGACDAPIFRVLDGQAFPITPTTAACAQRSRSSARSRTHIVVIRGSESWNRRTEEHAVRAPLSLPVRKTVQACATPIAPQQTPRLPF
jgi:hypothetical protein